MELVDVDYVRERDWYLRVYIDKPGGVDLDDCQLVSEKLSAVLDEKDPITENYLLEVSSPGLDRVLKKDKDLVRYNGRDVDIQLFKAINGSKQFTGALQGFTDTTIEFTINGQVFLDFFYGIKNPATYHNFCSCLLANLSCSSTTTR